MLKREHFEGEVILQNKKRKFLTCIVQQLYHVQFHQKYWVVGLLSSLQE